MELTVLGASGGWPAAGGAANGLLVRHEGFNFVLEFGMAVLPSLERHLPHEAIDAIFISHSHWDHCLDLYPLFLARFFREDRLPQVPVFAPRDVFDRLMVLEEEREEGEVWRSLRFEELQPGVDLEIGPFAVHTELMPHWVPSLGIKIASGDTALAYTGDTGPSDRVETLARGADLLVAEATWLDGQDRGRDPYHLTARQAGAHAAAADVGRLLLTHFWPTNDREVSGQQAAEAFDGPVLLAAEGLAIDVA